MDPARAVKDPYLAILSLLVHGPGKNIDSAVAVAAAAAIGAAGFPERQRLSCYALIEAALGDHARRAFAMLPAGQRFSDDPRRSFDEGKAKGKAEGDVFVHDVGDARDDFAVKPECQHFMAERRWFAEGRAEGEAKGRLEGLRAAVVAILDARSLPVSARGRWRLEACQEPEVLSDWLTRAVLAHNEYELFMMNPEGQCITGAYRRRWFAEGRVEGEGAGKLQALRHAVIAALDGRSLRVSRRGQSRLDACADPDVLTCWVERAVLAQSEDDVFDDE